jgi:hypothetical protein
MKKLIVALAFLPSLAFANYVKYDWTGVVGDDVTWDIAKPGDTVQGSFVLNNDVDPHFALSDIQYEVGGKTFHQSGPWSWQVGQDNVGFQDAPVGDFVDGDLVWDNSGNKNWFLNTMQKIGETVAAVHTGGRITSVSSSSDQWADAAPTPEPGTLALFGSSLIALAGFRRKKR